MRIVRIVSDRRESIVTADEAENLLRVLQREGFQVAAPCGGSGTCGKCLVDVVTGKGTEQRRACRTTLEDVLTVSLREESGGVIQETAAGAPEKYDSGREGYGAAVDLGTTTIVVRLFRLSDGEELGTKSAWSDQRRFGADVITRTQYTMEHENGLKELTELVRSQILSLLGELCRDAEIPLTEIKEIFLAGNTVMQHLFAGLSPAGIAVAPFRPETLFDDGREDLLRGIPIRYTPCVAGYVGGDITAGILAGGLRRKKGNRFFLDIGTNGEMALGGEDGFLCCAVASGPAFEGAGISCGMAGTDGAVSAVRWENGRLELDVIGGGTPKGICGSGLLDLLAILLREGVVDGFGRLLPPDEVPEEWRPLLREDENENGELWLLPDGSLRFLASDVRQLQLAKAAVAAGIAVLLKSAGISAGDVEEVCIAGGFGSRLDPQSAITMGMLPEEWNGRITPLGDTALLGASMALLSREDREELLSVKESCRYLELSGNADFNRLFPEKMLFCEEDEEEWN